MSNFFVIAILLVGLGCQSVFAADKENAIVPRKFPEPKHIVMTWVPPYGIEKVKARLNESFDGLGMKDGLTHLALQFWTPTKSGGIERAQKYHPITDAAIAGLRDWGHTNGVRVLLCVFNGEQSWNWDLARAGFVEHPREFADALIAEVERLDLDGVDSDLEGNGSFDTDKAAFVAFMRDLSAKLHAKGKHLTVDTFAYIWNAPNQNWWPDLLPLVDGLTTMGYEEIGAKADGWRSFAAQKVAAGMNGAKLLIGMPATKNEWRGNKASEQLRWVREDGGVSVSFWDAQLDAAAWRAKEVWSVLKEIRGLK